MKVVIFAAGGLGEVISEALELKGEHELAGFLDDKKRGSFCGYPILGKCAQYEKVCTSEIIEAVIFAFGYNFLQQRQLYYQRVLANKGLTLVNAIHPQAIISAKAKLGRGIYVGPGAVINPEAKIGDNSVIWSGTIIEHDNIIGANVFITPGVRTAGYAQIGDSTFIGMGAVVAKVKIGRNVTVGASSLVLSDVPANRYVWGHPAQIIKRKNKDTYV